MQEGRNYYVLTKPRIILDNRFGIRKELKVGDKGSILIWADIEAERLIDGVDGTTRLIKTLHLNKIEKLDLQDIRLT